jgi:hypothetical protein
MFQHGLRRQARVKATLQLHALGAAHGDAQRLHVQVEAGFQKS